MAYSFTKLSNPASSPAGENRATGVSPNGKWMVTANGNTGNLLVFKKTGQTFVFDHTETGVVAAGIVYGISWSADSTFLAIADTSATRKLFAVNQTTGVLTAQTLDTTAAGASWACNFHPTLSNYVVFCGNASPFIQIFKRSGTSSTWNQVATSATNLGNVTNAGWSYDGARFMYSGSTTPFIKVYSFNSSTGAITALTSGSGSGLVTTPTGASIGMRMGSKSDHIVRLKAAAPGFDFYKWNGTAYEVVTTPATGYTNGRYAAFAADGKHFMVTAQATPYLRHYELAGDTVTFASAQPTDPGVDSWNSSFTDHDRFYAVGHSVSPWVAIYTFRATVDSLAATGLLPTAAATLGLPVGGSIIGNGLLPTGASVVDVTTGVFVPAVSTFLPTAAVSVANFYGSIDAISTFLPTADFTVHMPEPIWIDGDGLLPTTRIALGGQPDDEGFPVVTQKSGSAVIGAGAIAPEWANLVAPPYAYAYTDGLLPTSDGLLLLPIGADIAAENLLPTMTGEFTMPEAWYLEVTGLLPTSDATVFQDIHSWLDTLEGFLPTAEVAGEVERYGDIIGEGLLPEAASEVLVPTGVMIDAVSDMLPYAELEGDVGGYPAEGDLIGYLPEAASEVRVFYAVTAELLSDLLPTVDALTGVGATADIVVEGFLPTADALVFTPESFVADFTGYMPEAAADVYMPLGVRIGDDQTNDELLPTADLYVDEPRKADIEAMGELPTSDTLVYLPPKIDMALEGLLPVSESEVNVPLGVMIGAVSDLLPTSDGLTWMPIFGYMDMLEGLLPTVEMSGTQPTHVDIEAVSDLLPTADVESEDHGYVYHWQIVSDLLPTASAVVVERSYAWINPVSALLPTAAVSVTRAIRANSISRSYLPTSGAMVKMFIAVEVDPASNYMPVAEIDATGWFAVRAPMQGYLPEGDTLLESRYRAPVEAIGFLPTADLAAETYYRVWMDLMGYLPTASSATEDADRASEATPSFGTGSSFSVGGGPVFGLGGSFKMG